MMKYYRDLSSKVWGYDPTTQALLIATAVTAGWTDVTSAWPPAPPSPTAAQQAATLLAAGLAVTSTGTPALSGTFATTANAVANVNAVITYILLNSTFPGGGTTMPWVDHAGSTHIFPSTTAFKAFATAFADFVAQAQLFADSNGAIGALPSNTVTIP